MGLNPISSYLYVNEYLPCTAFKGQSNDSVQFDVSLKEMLLIVRAVTSFHFSGFFFQEGLICFISTVYNQKCQLLLVGSGTRLIYSPLTTKVSMKCFNIS